MKRSLHLHLFRSRLSRPRHGHSLLATFASLIVFAALLAMLHPACRAQQRKPDIVLHGTVTYADRQTYREVPFRVGDGVTRVTVEFSYTGREQHTAIDLGLWDSQRFRGWSGGNKSSFTVANADATPSYLPGPTPPGTWKLILGIPNIESGVRSSFEAKIYFSHDGDVPEVSTFSSEPLRSGPAWYRGDLHMHDGNSDGTCRSQSGRTVPCPLYRTAEAAAARGLDFIAITDHNTISQFDEMRELQPYFDRLLLIPGREITTFEGHANVFGTTSFLDFRLGSRYVPSMDRMLDQVEQEHGLLSINHPGAPTGAACMGCGWSVPHTDYSRVNAVEAINGDTMDGPRSGIPFWQARLNQGFRLTAVGGSDNHDADIPPLGRWAIGHPTTVVHATNLSEREVLNAVRAGHVFVDLDGSRDRVLEFSASEGAQVASMGDAITATAGQTVHFTASMMHLEDAHPEVICDGQTTHLLDGSPVQTNGDTRSFDYTSDGKRHWLRINVRAADGRLLLLGNPIYLNFSRKP